MKAPLVVDMLNNFVTGKSRTPEPRGRTRGYDVIVPHDAAESLTAEGHEGGLRYPESTYAVKPLPTKELVAS